MKSKIALVAVALATIFSSCSKEANFTNSGQAYGGYHKTEQAPVAQTNSTAQEITLTASTETAEPQAAKTVAFSAKKVVKSEKASVEAAPLAATNLSKKEVKALAKEIKKEVKQNQDGKAEGKSQVIALLLMLIWPLSIHRFYLGYTGIAIAQILTLGGCGIWALIDLIRIITGDLKPKDGEYAKTL